MKILLLTALLFVSMAAHATYTQSPSYSQSYAQGGDVTDESITNMINEYSPVASSAASMALSGCSVGMSAQTDDGGVMFGGVAQICKDEKILMIAGTRMVGLIVSAEKELEIARDCKTSDPKRYKAHLDRAHGYMMHAQAIYTESELIFK